MSFENGASEDTHPEHLSAFADAGTAFAENIKLWVDQTYTDASVKKAQANNNTDPIQVARMVCATEVLGLLKDYSDDLRKREMGSTRNTTEDLDSATIPQTAAIVGGDSNSNSNSNRSVDLKPRIRQVEDKTSTLATKSDLKVVKIQMTSGFELLRADLKTHMAESKEAMSNGNANVKSWILATVLTLCGTLVVGLFVLLFAIYNSARVSVLREPSVTPPPAPPMIINITPPQASYPLTASAPIAASAPALASAPISAPTPAPVSAPTPTPAPAPASN